jgi:hypothetical protein
VVVVVVEVDVVEDVVVEVVDDVAELVISSSNVVITLSK